MSTVKYCADPEPHEMHGWQEEFTYGPAIVTGVTTFTDYHTCWGVKPTPELERHLRMRNQARTALAYAEVRLTTAALAARRTEAEALHYDPEDQPT